MTHNALRVAMGDDRLRGATETAATEQMLNRHMAKVMIIKLLIMQAEHWTFDSDDRLLEQDRILLRQVRDEYVEQLKGNLKFAERALQR